jgi:hypothetical protein
MARPPPPFQILPPLSAMDPIAVLPASRTESVVPAGPVGILASETSHTPDTEEEFRYGYLFIVRWYDGGMYLDSWYDVSGFMDMGWEGMLAAEKLTAQTNVEARAFSSRVKGMQLRARFNASEVSFIRTQSPLTDIELVLFLRAMSNEQRVSFLKGARF